MRRETDGFALLHREGALALLMAGALTMNALLPRFSTGIGRASVMRRILDSQTAALVQFFSLTTLPLRIIGELFPGTPALPSSRSTEKGKKTDPAGSAGASAEFGLFAFEGAASFIRRNARGKGRRLRR